MRSITKTIHITVFCGMILSCMVYFATQSIVLAQESAPQQSKPKLAAIVLDEATNDPKAVEIVRKIASYTFDIPSEFAAEDDSPQHIAKYIALDENNPKRFIIYTIQNTSFYCTSFGCPVFIYENSGENQWREVFSVQTYNIYQDLNTKSQSPDNLITTGVINAQNVTSIWLWNGQKYARLDGQ